MRDKQAYSKHTSSINHVEHNLFKKCRDRHNFMLNENAVVALPHLCQTPAGDG